MSDKHSKLPLLLAAFAAATGLAVYGLAPHEVGVNVISRGVVSDARGNIVERYLLTDKGS